MLFWGSELLEQQMVAAIEAAAMARALRARGLGDSAATLAAWTAMTIMHVDYEQWAEDPGQAPFRQIARDALAQLREIASAG